MAIPLTAEFHPHGGRNSSAVHRTDNKYGRPGRRYRLRHFSGRDLSHGFAGSDWARLELIDRFRSLPGSMPMAYRAIIIPIDVSFMVISGELE